MKEMKKNKKSQRRAKNEKVQIRLQKEDKKKKTTI